MRYLWDPLPVIICLQDALPEVLNGNTMIFAADLCLLSTPAFSHLFINSTTCKICFPAICTLLTCNARCRCMFLWVVLRRGWWQIRPSRSTY